MRTFKKSLSVFLCFVMLFSTFCFFPLTGLNVEADAATITNEGRKTAFYVPEVIYLYPSVSSWTADTSAPFQYFVENTVDVNDIYKAPVPSANTATEGKIYFAAEEGMNAVRLRYSFVSTSGLVLTDGDITVSEASAYDGYIAFDITEGNSPVLSANENGCYIEWILEYTTDAGEIKASHAVTYVYKPYVVPYGAVARVANKQGDVNVDNQNITWVTGVHSIDVTVATKNQLFARYQTVEESASGSLAFSPFLSKDRYGYVGANMFQGDAPVAAGGYYAVFSNKNNTKNAYFWAGQSGTSINNRADSWFVLGSLSSGDKAYNVGTFDYMHNEDFNTKYAISQITPTRLGTINIDTSRYSNLNEIPNLAVGFMVTSNSAIKGGNTQAKAEGNWLIGDATGKAHKETGAYTTANDMTYAVGSQNTGVDASSVFASETVAAYPIANGIKYAGAWNKELSEEATEKYTVKSVVRIDDTDSIETKYAVTSSAVGLNAVQIDKTALRAAVAEASGNLGALGMKRNKMSLYYAASGSDWNTFSDSYMNAYKVLTRLDATAAEVTAATDALNAALEALLCGKSLKVLFDVNYDGIKPNLLATVADYSSTSLTLSYNKNTGEYTLNGTITADAYPLATDMSISEGEYTVSIEKTAGEYIKNPMTVGTVVLELFPENGQFPEALRPKIDVYEDVTYGNYTYSLNESIADQIRSFKLWVWRNGNVPGEFKVTNLTYKLKLETGNAATAYSPAAKIITGESYGELPVPTRDGFSFGGWFADKECTVPVTADDAVTARVLYADWIPNVYSVAFDNMFSLNEFAKYPSSLTANRANAAIGYADGKLTVSANNTTNQDVYSTYGCGSNYYNIDILPSTEYVFEYDVVRDACSQVHIFLYDVDNGNATVFPVKSGSTVYDTDGNLISDVTDRNGDYAHCYSRDDGHVVIRFTTPEGADKLAVRFGTSESSTTTAVYSDIRLIDAKTYDLIKWNSAEMFYDYGESYVELATATRDGYVFDGWYTGKNGTGTKVTTNDSVTPSNITLYSNWTANTYNVTLLPNNAGYGNTIKINGCIYDKEFTLPDVTSEEYNYNKVGHTFIGWATSPDATAREYANKATVKNLTPDVNGEVNLYAVWAPNVFKVQFDANGGTGTMADAEVSYNSNVPLPECTFTNTGYTFAGWSLSNQGSPITEAQYDVLKETAGDTAKLFALWRENYYTVTFDKNAENAEGSGSPISGSYATQITLPGEIFSRTGYKLTGWATTPDGAKAYELNQSVSKLTSKNEDNVVLYAVWTPVTYKISFNANGGQGSMDSRNATYDKDFVLPACSFTKAGYNFVGWSTSYDGTNPYAAGTAVKNLAAIQDSTVTLFAVWEIKTYTVTLIYKNAQGTEVTTTTTVKHGESVALPSDFVQNPIAGNKKHSVFTGWSTPINNVTSSFTSKADYSLPADCSLNVTTTPATCTKEGSIVTKCLLCAYETTEVIDKIPHSEGEGEITTPVTCLEGGVKTYECTVCHGTRTEKIEAPGHSLTLVPAKDAACNAPGNVAHQYCSLCKKGYDPETATATTPYEDAIDYVVTVAHTPGVAPTCTTAQVCTVCGTELTPALGHTFRIEYISENHVDCSTTKGDYTIKKTCTVTGCGVVEIEYVYNSFLPHDYVVTTVPPTCTEPGYDLHDCSRCTEKFTDNEVPALGHNDEGQDWVKLSDPTCTVPGEKVKYCTVCRKVSRTQEISATGHADESVCEWRVTDSTCTEAGKKELICPDCNGVVRTETIALKAHSFRWTVTIEPGCETVGRETNKCTVCGATQGNRELPKLGHTPDHDATCEADSVCTRCHKVVREKLGHDWNNGSVVKEPTETEEGLREFICLNDPSHKDYQVIPVRIVIQLPEIPAGGAYVLNADMNGYLGNIHTIIKVEDGIDYSVLVDNTGILTINDAGYMMAVKDGNAVITIITNDGKFQKQLPVTVRTYRTITFDVNGELVEIKAYAGDSFTPPTVNSFTDENGYEARFKQWLLNGTALKEFICTGDMYLVAQFTSSCDYDKLDELTAVFYDIISGKYNNALLLNVYKQEINTAKAMIDEFALDRNVRDSEEQGRVDAAAKHLAATIAKIYPEEGAWIEIRGNTECTAGTYADITAYLMPINVELADGVWESSDATTGFFVNGKFYAVKQGSVILTVSRGSLSASIEIIINSTVGARVVFFDTLLTDANYILEGSYVIRETTSLFWAPDAAINFRVITGGTYETYNVYINNKKVTPDIRGTYTIPAGTGDAHVRIEGLMSDITDDSDDSTPTMSIWDTIRNFFKKIGDFFRNLFGM